MIRISPRGSLLLALGAAACLAALAAVPWLAGNYWMRILTNVMMYCVVAQGLNVIVGFAGYHAFGNAAFFGIGAYALGVSEVLGLGFLPSIPVAAAVSALIAALVGWPLLRLRGHYFAIATVALTMAVSELVTNIGGITGGAQGLALPLDTSQSPEQVYRQIYFLMFGLAVLSTLVVWHLSGSRLGYALRALKDSERGAMAMGIDTRRAKVAAWAISAALTGAAGAIWAHWMTFIEVSSAFDITLSVKGYIMMLIGGMGTIFGPLLGAAFFEFFSTLIWSRFTEVHNLVLGVLVCVVVLALPFGIWQPLRRLWHDRQGRGA